ncbi:MAG TPA: glycosyltransferase family 39 protein [Candidatus Obscuribacterales bacterium]
MKLFLPPLISALSSPGGRWLGGGLAARLLVALLLPVGFDEAYYYLYSRHLAWSYFDHPLMVALTTGLGWWPTGIIAPVTLRLGALLLYTLSLGLLYLTARHLFDEKTGILTIAIATIAPIFWLAFGVLTSPDNGLILFWTLTLWLAAQEFVPPATHRRALHASTSYEPSYRLALIGLTVGLACLSKYHGFILGAGLVGFCLTSDRTRKALWSPWLALGFLLFGLALAPLWGWNSQNEWFSFRFHLFLRFDSGADAPNPYRVGDAVVTWLLGILYLCPTIGLPLWWCAGRSLWRTVGDRLVPALSEGERIAGDRTALILWISLPIALGFTLLGGKQAIYPAWPVPGFWGLTLLLAHRATDWRSRLVRRWLGGTALFLTPLVLVALLHLTLGLLQKPSVFAPWGGLVPVAQDGSTALLPVGQLRSRFAQQPDLMAALATADFVFTDEFYLSGYVDMALYPLGGKPITCFSQDPRGFAFWATPQTWVGQTALYVTLASLHRDRAALIAEFQSYFASLEPLGELPLTRGGAVTDTVLVYRTTAMQRPYPYPYP